MGLPDALSAGRARKAQLPDELRCSAMEILVQDGRPPLATVARRQGRSIEIIADPTAGEPSNDSVSSFGMAAAASTARARTRTETADPGVTTMT